MNKEYITVSKLNFYIKNVLEKDSNLSYVFLKGEISNLTKHASGHWYFSLKDEESRINAVMFRSASGKVNFDAEDGMNVLVIGRVSAYPAHGSYQIYVNEMQLDGLGNLYLEFEKLKKKLDEEGLFKKEHKKPIPKYPEKIGVITAKTGAAIKDIITTIKRRYPLVEIILFPSLVQGDAAASDIVSNLKLADTYNLDTIILGRGGGSIEDLWPFNEEIVAREIFKAKTPIISAVGHEIDFTISDYVADLRAPTPTAAAELAVPSIIDLSNYINQFHIRLNKNIKNTVNTKYLELKNLKTNYILNNPLSMYEIKVQKLDTLNTNINNLIKNILDNNNNKLNNLKSSYVMMNPLKIIESHSNILDKYIINLKNLNPLNILKKGYSVVKHNDKVVISSKKLKKDDIVNIRFEQGSINAIVKETLE